MKSSSSHEKGEKSCKSILTQYKTQYTSSPANLGSFPKVLNSEYHKAIFNQQKRRESLGQSKFHADEVAGNS